MTEMLNLSGYHYRQKSWWSFSAIITAAGIARSAAKKRTDLFDNPDGKFGRETFYTPERAKAIIKALAPKKPNSTIATDFISGKFRPTKTAASSASGVLNLAGQSTGAHYE